MLLLLLDILDSSNININSVRYDISIVCCLCAWIGRLQLDNPNYKKQAAQEKRLKTSSIIHQTTYLLLWQRVVRCITRQAECFTGTPRSFSIVARQCLSFFIGIGRENALIQGLSKGFRDSAGHCLDLLEIINSFITQNQIS
jgi:hypothetical protein